jgi:hypothetical protein
MSRVRSKLTSENLKQTLWETVQGLKSKKVDPLLANAIASQSREIMRIVNAEIRIAQMNGQKPQALPK